MLIVQIKNGNIERGLKELKGKFLKTKVRKITRIKIHACEEIGKSI